ncbi:MAG: hypothetical protein AB7Q16_15400 [Vicinamibacterales bacterium]
MSVIASPTCRFGVRVLLCATISVSLGLLSTPGQASTRLHLQGLVTARESLQAPPAVPVRGARVTVLQGDVVIGTAATDVRGLFSLELEGVAGEVIVQTSCAGDAMGQAIEAATSDSITARGPGYFAPATTLKAEPPTDRPADRVDLWTEIECSKYTLTASTDPVLPRFFGRGVEEPWRKVTTDSEHVVVPVFYATDRIRLSSTGECGATASMSGASRTA